MNALRVALDDPSLFGNDAAEDEDEDVFISYALERPEVSQFLAPGNRICIARALKGEGKSALLRFVKIKLRQQNPPPIIVEATGRQLSPDLNSVDTDVWVRQWKRSIMNLVAREIGARINLAWSDDAISLVEEAEANGFRSRSVISSIFDRLKSQAVPIERTRLDLQNPEKLVQRWSERTDGIWLIIDDIDENFQNTPTVKTKVASFFIAAREIANVVPQLRIRLAIRPNTWTTLAYEYESLSKVDQYNVDLRWSELNILDVVARRIRAYLKRTDQLESFCARIPGEPKSTEYMEVVFESPVEWGNRKKPVHVPLATLSQRRPRWTIELCREAGKAAKAQGVARIFLSHIDGCLEAFGKRRIANTVAEFSPQCPEINELISAFSRQSEEYATSDLITTVERRILQSVKPKIIGVIGTPSAVDVAAFLFQIGFLSAKRNLGGDDYEHLTYNDQPSLLRTRTNLDDGVRWEIHPVFRQALQLRDSNGRSLRPIPFDRRGR